MVIPGDDNIFSKLLKYTKWIANQAKSSFLPLLLLIAAGVVSSLTTVFIALQSKKLFDAAQFGKIDNLIHSGIIIIAIVLLQTLMRSVMSVYTSKISASLSNDFRQKLFEKLSGANWFDFTKYHSEDLLTRMTSDVDIVTNGVTSVIPDMISLFFNLCASFIVLMTFDPTLALFAFILGPLSILFTRLFGKKLSEYHLRIQETESNTRGFIQERLRNMHIVKSFMLERESGRILSVFQNTKLDWIIRRSKINAVSSAVLTLSFWLGFLLAVLWGSVQLSKGAATFGTITVYLQLVGQIQEPFVGLAYSIPQVIIMYASAGRLMKVYEMKGEIIPDTGLNWHSAGIRAESLDFSYGKDAVVLSGAGFDIKPGEFVAVVGTSGEGKTTFIRLLLSLLYPTGGVLSFYNPETRLEQPAGVVTRSLASYVPQGNTLFSGTIAENVKLGNKTASENELKEALKKACIWDFVDSLPDKAETIIGENGYGLSEGQAQRISIARALILKKPVLVLDEATSALDSETELEVLESIASIRPLPTCIIITHRKTALDFCNRVFTIENGRMDCP